MMTSWPRWMCCTSLPISSTTPIASWPIGWPPGVSGRSLYGQRSLPQMQARVTRMIASVGCLITASGTFSIVTSRALCITVARILCFFLHGRFTADHCHLRRSVALTLRLDPRRSLVELFQVTARQLDSHGANVLVEPMNFGRAGDRDDVRPLR